MTNFLAYLPQTVLFLAILIFVVMGFISFLKMPREMQEEALMEFLKWQVFKAEKKLGSGTGQLKLREVYGMAIQQFPWIAEQITFERFSQMVDEALVWMRKQIEQNKNIKEYVEGSDGQTYLEVTL